MVSTARKYVFYLARRPLQAGSRLQLSPLVAPSPTRQQEAPMSSELSTTPTPNAQLTAVTLGVSKVPGFSKFLACKVVPSGDDDTTRAFVWWS